MRLHRILSLTAAGWLVILVILIWSLPFNEDFRIGNPYWNGLGDLTAAGAVPIETLSELPSSPGSSLLLIPYLSLSSSDLARIKTFVSQGGTLILADDYGYGNQVLESLGIRSRFSGQVLLDPLANYKNQSLPKISRLKSNAITADSRTLVFNHATGLQNVDSADVLATSSAFSFIDTNGNGKWDEREPQGPIPVVSKHNLGNGAVVLISDPSVFINSMDKLGSNAVFISNVARSPGTLFVDQSHLPQSNLHHSKTWLASVRAVLVTPVGTLCLLLAAVWLILYPIWYKKINVRRISNNERSP